MSPTDCSDDASKLKIARRLGSARMANADSTSCMYVAGNMPVKEYKAPCPSASGRHGQDGGTTRNVA